MIFAQHFLPPREVFKLSVLQMVSGDIRTQALSGPSLIRKAYAISDGFLAYPPGLLGT